MTQISGASRIFLAATQQEGYIFYRQVKFDRLQLLPLARLISLNSSKNTATTKVQFRCGSIACDRQYATNPLSKQSPRYPTSLTIAESDFDNCLPIGSIVLR
ncbi:MULTISPECIES: hypothetical protein [unclassified Microcoleus]|uniref:hypothetical protein n=1 Tax=unclassified Microcoleus TaxID=2642155 RepID=UPI002FD2FCE9